MELQTICPEELKEILRKHKLWLARTTENGNVNDTRRYDGGFVQDNYRRQTLRVLYPT